VRLKHRVRTAEGETLAISIPRSEAHVVRHFQERMPYGLFVPDDGAVHERGRCLFLAKMDIVNVMLTTRGLT
jgi:hypothetical protein